MRAAVLLLLLAQPTNPTAAAGTAPAGPAEASVPWAPTPVPEWQQEVHYTIEARLDEGREALDGALVLAYRNASPEALDRLWFHLHLNAFRPGSVWSRTEQRPQYDFSALEEPDFGYERLGSVTLQAGAGTGDGGGVALTPVFPHAPDSTVVYFDLPAPLASGDSLVVRMEWEARPSTLCRRQCRRGRHYDFAQWYPRIAVYDDGGWQTRPLYPQGEFYGEFGTYDVTLDLAADQVVGATGVPLEGDPGYRPVGTSPVEEPPLKRDWYRGPVGPRSPGLLTAAPGEGRKRVRFYAEDVHHFAWSTDPDYRYEGGVHARGPGDEVAIHVLFRPGDLDWDLAAVVRRTIRALAWLEEVFGPYPYPQLTNLHRLEDGGTEFPMLIMDGGPQQGLIAHETAHQYAHGILANNEWAEAWLDEGLASFLDTWFYEEHGAPDPWSGGVRAVARMAADPGAQPVATRSEEFRDFGTYGAMSYTKPAVVFLMLRWLVGEETFRGILQAYYERYRFRHVDEAAFRGVAEEVSGRDLDWFFDAWLHGTGALDYGLEEVSVERADGGWRTRAVVVRSGEVWMPVDLRVGDELRRLESRDVRQSVEVMTAERPTVVELDPAGVLPDTDPGNDRWVAGSGEAGGRP